MKMEKSKKHINFSKVFGIIFCLVTFGLMITMADLFSSLITVGGFSFVNDNINFSEYKLYAVYTAKYQEKILANESSENIKMQGGAGFLYMNENSYYIIASIYETEADAKKVLTNIIEKKPDASIITITIPQIVISSNLEGQEKSVVNNSLSLFKNVYKKLYDISVSLDTTVINEVNAKLTINEIYSEVQTALNNFNTIFNGNVSTSLLKIKLGLEEIETHLDDLINTNLTLPFTSLVKECYCKVIYSYKNIASHI